MLSVGSVGTRPLSTPRVSFKGEQKEDAAIEKQKEGISDLKDTVHSQNTPKLIKKLAEIALLVGVGALGYSTFDKCAPRAMTEIKKGYKKTLSSKNRASIEKNIGKAAKTLKNGVKKLDAKLLTSAQKAIAKSEKCSAKKKVLEKSLNLRESTIKTTNHAVKWAKNDGPTWVRKTMAVLTGGTSVIETHQELTENKED